MSSTLVYITTLRSLSPFGLAMTIRLKLIKHLKRRDVKKVRMYLALLKVAYPKLKVSDTVDHELMNQARDLISPYYAPNKYWNEGNHWLGVFRKLKEPPVV